MIKGKEKRTFSVLFSSSASDKRQERKAFVPFFLFPFKEGSRPLARLCLGRGRKVHRCFLFLFFFLLLSERKRKMISAYGCWRSLLFSFRLQEKKRRYNASANGERKNIHAFQKERSEKNDDLVPCLFPFLFQKEKWERLSVILSVEKREDA